MWLLPDVNSPSAPTLFTIAISNCPSKIQSPYTWRCCDHGNRLSVRVRNTWLACRHLFHPHLFNSPRSEVCGLGRSFPRDSIPIFQTTRSVYGEIASCVVFVFLLESLLFLFFTDSVIYLIFVRSVKFFLLLVLEVYSSLFHNPYIGRGGKILISDFIQF